MVRVYAMHSNTYRVECPECDCTLEFGREDVHPGPSTYRDDGCCNFTLTCPSCGMPVTLGYNNDLSRVLAQYKIHRYEVVSGAQGKCSTGKISC